MGKIGLQICATLENVDELKTCHPDYSFFLKIKCSNCGEESNKWHDLTESEKTDQDSRWDWWQCSWKYIRNPSLLCRNPDGFNFYAKCKLCNRENSMDVLPGTNGKDWQ